MLCKRSKTLTEAVKLIQGHMANVNPALRVKNPNGQFVIEEKLDGERMQLHKRGNQYFYSSRYVVYWIDRLRASKRRNEAKGRIIPTSTAPM